MTVPFSRRGAFADNPFVRFPKRGRAMITETRYEHIHLAGGNVPIISGTTMKVVELVLAHQAYGRSPEALHFQHPYLTLGQIYSALAYYWDHREALDRDIERRLQGVKQLSEAQAPNSLQRRLKAQGMI